MIRTYVGSEACLVLLQGDETVLKLPISGFVIHYSENGKSAKASVQTIGGQSLCITGSIETNTRRTSGRGGQSKA